MGMPPLRVIFSKVTQATPEEMRGWKLFSNMLSFGRENAATLKLKKNAVFFFLDF